MDPEQTPHAGRRPERPEDASPVGAAMVWSSRIMAIGMAMFLPGVIGGWADARFGLRFLGPAGFVLGFVAALTWLVRIGNRPQEHP